MGFRRHCMVLPSISIITCKIASCRFKMLGLVVVIGGGLFLSAFSLGPISLAQMPKLPFS